jgi:hypothetical protein
MERIRALVSASSLVASPLLVLAYWLTYPAYGVFGGEEIIREVDRAPVQTSVSDVFITLGAFLAVPMSLALMRALRGPAPRLALVGGCLSVIGWIGVAVLVMTDVVAVEIANQGPSKELVGMFEDLLTNPLVIALNVAASLHLIGGVLIGVALVRSRMIPRWLAIGATLAPPVHLASNLAGQLWLDSITWLVVAAAYAYAIPEVTGTRRTGTRRTGTRWARGGTQQPDPVAPN